MQSINKKISLSHNSIQNTTQDDFFRIKDHLRIHLRYLIRQGVLGNACKLKHKIANPITLVISGSVKTPTKLPIHY